MNSSSSTKLKNGFPLSQVQQVNLSPIKTCLEETVQINAKLLQLNKAKYEEEKNYQNLSLFDLYFHAIIASGLIIIIPTVFFFVLF